MNKYLAGLLSCSMALALVACGGGSSGNSKNTSSAPVSSSSSVAALPSSSPASSVESSGGQVSSATESSTDGIPASSAPASSPAVSSSLANSSSDASSAVAVSSGSIASSSSSSVTVVAGVFVDSAVAGVTYQTNPGGFSGVTSATGQYLYAEGDTVTFSIGEIEFPAVTAKGVVTPVDMAPSGDINDPIVVNIAVLLQSLDSDGDASNGISIPPAAVEAAVTSVDFNQSYSDFATDVLHVVQHSDNSKSVVDAAVATAHLEQSLAQTNAGALVGAWYVETEEYKYVLFVLDDSRYAALDFDSTVTNGSALETGTYVWNQETGEVTLSSVVRTDNALDAMPPMATGNTLQLDGNKLTLVDQDETFELDRLIASEESPLKGGWSLTDGEALIVFGFTGTHYFMGQSAGDDNGVPGAEMGTYVYNNETKEIRVNTLVDTNGQWGLSHPCAVLNDGSHSNYEEPNYLACGPDGRDIVQTLAVTGDPASFISEAHTISLNGEEEEVMFGRVNGLPDGDIHLTLELTLTLTEYSQGALYTSDNATMQCDMDEGRVVGDVEVVNESWVLGSNPNRLTWLGAQPAGFNPDTRVISFDVHEPVAPVPGHPGFYEEFWDSFEGTYNPGESQVITGTYTEKYNLTWTRDSSVSTCEATYTVTGVLR